MTEPTQAGTARILEAHAALEEPGASDAAVRPQRASDGSAVGATPWRPGDLAVLRLSVTADGDARVAFPTREELDAALGGRAVIVEERPVGEPRPADVPGVSSPTARTQVGEWMLQLLVPPGEHELGPFPVTLKTQDGEAVDVAAVPAVPVAVGTVLPEELAAELDAAADSPDAAVPLQQVAHQALAPVRGPWAVERPVPWAWWAGGLLAALALALFAAWLWRRRRGGTAVAPEPPREAAEVEARRRLDALLASGLLEQGQAAAFHVELADALKTYLGRRYTADFVDRTTGEVRRLLHGPLAGAPAIEELRGEILAILAHCDLVKFARQVPPREDALARARQARDVVDRSTRAVAEHEEARRRADEATPSHRGVA